MTQRRVVVLILLLVGLGAVLPAGGAAQSPVDQAVSMSTDYDGTTPSQEVQVTLTIEPEETKLTDVAVEFQPGSLTLIQTDSYTSTVSPSNHDVSISSDGQNGFTIPELKPGESVDITFSVVPSTLEEQQLTPAKASVEFTQNGQRLDGTVSESVTLTQNPWERAQSSQRPGWLFLVGAGTLGAAIVAGVAGVYYRRRFVAERNRVVNTLRDQIDSVKRAGGPTVERRAERVVKEVRGAMNLDVPEETDADDDEESAGGPGLGRLLTRKSTDRSSGPHLGSTESDDESGPEL